MNRPIPLLSLALAVWIIGGALWYYNSGCCVAAGAASITTPALSVIDGSTQVAGHAANLRFGISGEQPIISNQVKEEYEKVANYLNTNPAKGLLLTGLYAGSETNNSQAENLGLARADQLKAYLVGLGAKAGQIKTGAEKRDELFEHESEVYGAMDYSFSEMMKGLSISDASKFSAGAAANTLFAFSGFEHVKPLDANVNGAFQKTADYLKANTDRTINLTGYYSKDEKNTSIFPNLGLARANDIKTLLINLGAPAAQIATKGVLTDANLNADKNWLGGIAYDFGATPEKADDRLADIRKRLLNKPITLYFQTGNWDLDLSNQQRNDFADIIYYLSNVSKSFVESKGHADNQGDPQNNEYLSRKRAEKVNSYLVRNGIQAVQTRLQFAGDKEPVSSNDTPEGRAKNRRVVVTLK